MEVRDVAAMIAVSLELAGGQERGTYDANDEAIQDLMRQRGLSYTPELFEATRLLMNCFMSFSQDVRAAERLKKPIVRVQGEKDLPQT